MRSSPVSRTLPPLIVAACLSAIYLRTLAPDITWANDGSDGGDLIAAAATGGVAHPTGYPLYLLLARLFQLLPWGSLAFRTNLMSVVAAVVAALLVYQIMARSRRSSSGIPAWSNGLVAAFAFGLTPLVWSQAVVAEVYTLQACLTAWIVYLYTGSNPVAHQDRKRLDGWRGLALGLALCNQIIAILFLPAALLIGSIEHAPEGTDLSKPGRTWFRHLTFNRAALTRQLFFLGMGSCLYLLLPLRALAHPPVNWGNVITPARLWWLVSGGEYQSYYLQFNDAALWERIQAFTGLLIEQFGLVGLALGLSGLILFARRSRLYILTAWIALVSLGFAVLYGSADSFLYLVPLLMSFSIWAGSSLAELASGLYTRSPVLSWALSLIVMAYFVLRPVTYLSEVDASGDRQAQIFGMEALSAVPEDAILFSRGDKAVFALWYFHFALGERPDLVVLAEDLLHFDWYQETLHATYPSLLISETLPWPETLAADNPTRPVCYVRFIDAMDLSCQAPASSP